MTERMTIYGDLNIFLGVWTSSLILLPIGIFLTVKATSDSPLLDSESWYKAFAKITSLFKKSKK
jgi:lipopolysaccharide export system permease protein